MLPFSVHVAISELARRLLPITEPSETFPPEDLICLQAANSPFQYCRLIHNPIRVMQVTDMLLLAAKNTTTPGLSSFYVIDSRIETRHWQN